MNEKSTIRFAKKTDIDQIILLCQAHATYEESDYDARGKAEVLSKDLFSKTPKLFCLVVEKEGQLIGYTTYMLQYSTWDAGQYIYMDCLYMTEASRGLGIGEQLVNRIKEEAAVLGCNLIQWQTPTFNTGAIKFYQRIGAYAKSKERFFLAF